MTDAKRSQMQCLYRESHPNAPVLHKRLSILKLPGYKVYARWKKRKTEEEKERRRAAHLVGGT